MEVVRPHLGWALLMLAVLDAEVVSAEPAELRALLDRLARRFQQVAEPG